jgi:hypothetical protein
VGAGALVLLAATFLLKWYALKPTFAPTQSQLGRATSLTAWDALSVTRWLILVTVLLGFSVVYTQGTRRGPALPVVLTAITGLVALITSLVLINRVLISEPGRSNAISQRVGAFVGMFSAISMVIAAYLSLREDGIRPVDGPGEIETLSLGSDF